MAIIIASIALLVSILAAAALVELYDGLRSVQHMMGVTGEPAPLDLPDAVGSPPSAHGLPAVLDNATAAVLVFVSPRCGTCHSLVKAWNGSIPDRMHLVVTDAVRADTVSWLGGYSIPIDHSVTIDDDGAVAASIGVEATPVAVVVRDGVIVYAETVATAAALESLGLGVQA